MIYPSEKNNKLKIKIFGIGGGGGNILNALINHHQNLDFQLENVQLQYFALNTDGKALASSLASYKIQLGRKLTQGYGSGGKLEIGEQAVLEAEEEIRQEIKNTDLLILITCLGGGTGSGATPKIVEWAKEANILTLIITTKPFSYEGKTINMIARVALEKIENLYPSVIVVANDQIREKLGNLAMEESFSTINKMIAIGLTDLIKIIDNSQLIGIDLADIEDLVTENGQGVITFGESEEEEKAYEAAFNSPLVNKNIGTAKKVLLWVCGNSSLSVEEVSNIFEKISKKIENQNVKIRFTFMENNDTKKKIRVGFFATGIIKEALEKWEAENFLENYQNGGYEEKLNIPNVLEKKIDKNNLSLPTILRALFL
jgi:cell division protein FtsZ